MQIDTIGSEIVGTAGSIGWVIFAVSPVTIDPLHMIAGIIGWFVGLLLTHFTDWSRLVASFILGLAFATFSTPGWTQLFLFNEASLVPGVIIALIFGGAGIPVWETIRGVILKLTKKLGEK